MSIDIRTKKARQIRLSQKTIKGDEKSYSFYGGIIKFSIYSLVFLMPVFFLSCSYEIVEYNKQIILWFFSGIAFLAWILKMVFVDKEIRVRKDFLSLAAAAAVVLNFCVFLFSKNPYASLWGSYAARADSFIGLASLAAVFFVVSNNKELFSQDLSENKESEKSRRFSLLSIFLFSTAISEIVLIFSVFGGFKKILNLGPVWAKSLFFSLLDSNFNTLAPFKEGAAIFLAVMLCAGAFKLCFNKEKQKSSRVFNSVFVVLTLFSLIILNFKSVWIILAITMAGLIIFAMRGRLMQKISKPVNVIWPLVVIIISLLLFFNIPQRIKYLKINTPNITSEIRLSAEDSAKIAASSLRENLFFGAGQGNFSHAFSKFKPAYFGNSDFRFLRFNKAYSYVLELASTSGILGIIFWLIIVGSFTYLLIYKTGRNSKDKVNNVSEQAAFGVFALIITQFFYSSTTLLLFAFWLFLALFAAELQIPSDGSASGDVFRKFPEILIIADFVSILLVILFAGFLFSAGKKYKASIEYAKAMYAEENQVFEHIQRAASMDSKNSFYPMALANVYFAKLSKSVETSGGEIDDEIKKLAGEIQKNAELASKLSPNSADVWELAGMAYENTYPILGGSADAAIDAFKKAIELEPNGSQLKFELGKVQYNKGDIDGAMLNFQNALAIYPNYSNALYSLALCHIKKDNKIEALEYMNRVLELNPENEDIKDKILELEGKGE